MNIYVLIAGILSFISFMAHAFIGTKETLQTRTDFSDETVKKNWYQSFLAWHLITADLLLSSILLIVIAASNYLENRKTIAFFFALQYLFWTFSCLITLFVTRARKYYKQLYQWVMFLICSILLFYGMNRFEN